MDIGLSDKVSYRTVFSGHNKENEVKKREKIKDSFKDKVTRITLQPLSGGQYVNVLYLWKYLRSINLIFKEIIY